MAGTLSTTELNGLLIERVLDDSGKTELRLCPAERKEDRVPHRADVGNRPENGGFMSPKVENPDHILQFRAVGDSMVGGRRAGTTMHDSASINGFKTVKESSEDRAGLGGESIVTVMENEERGLRICQYLEPTAVPGTLRTWSSIQNHGNEPITMEHLTSFLMAGMTPFAVDDAPGRLFLHRFRSFWSQEGRHVCESLEDLHLIRSWAGFNVVSERFGQVGTLPVQQYFPFVALEDREAGVMWGAQLAWAGSWQMEVSRRADTVSLSGGLADFELGHWRKVLQPGESFTTPVAHLACVSGNLESLTHRLVKLQESLLTDLPESEESLPVMFNEWCTNWGSPTHDKTIALAKRLRGTGVKYLVIDDGWAERPKEARMQSNGDWILDREKFPQGMKALCDELRQMGFTPGIWFEFEVCNPGSKAFDETDHLLQRDGIPLQVGKRRFWDLNDPWAVDYLDDRMIRFLVDNGFGYLKVDYNDTIGIGCDHPDSIGEGLRRHVEGVHSFFDRIRTKVPGLVIENCSSGGHRLEPSMMGRTALSSFSDSHECWAIPIIARQLHHLMPPRQEQIWAVLYPEDDTARTVFSLAATFYGRMCLSGPVHDLTEGQMELLREAIKLYEEAAPIIKEGKTHFLGETPDNWNHPTGWSGICRTSGDESRALVVLHTFAEGPEDLHLELPLEGDWSIHSQFVGPSDQAFHLDGRTLDFKMGGDFRGSVFILSTEQP